MSGAFNVLPSTVFGWKDQLHSSLNSSGIRDPLSKMARGVQSWSSAFNLKDMGAVLPTSAQPAPTVSSGFFHQLDLQCAELLGTNTPNKPGVNFLAQLSDDLVLGIASFLDSCSLGKLCAANRRAAMLLTRRYEAVVWAPHLLRDFGQVPAPAAATTAREAYMRCLLSQAVAEHNHYQAVQKDHAAVHAFARQFPGRVCLQLADFATVPDERMARVLSLKRDYAMGTLIVERSVDIMAFKRAQARSGGPGGRPMNFLPLDAAHPLDFDLAGRMREMPRIEFPGLIDYAVHLFDLRPEHERYRYSVLYTLLKNLLVFRSARDIEAFAAAYGAVPYAVALDEYSEAELAAPGRARFSWGGFRPGLAAADPRTYGPRLGRRVGALQTALAFLQYNSSPV